MQLYCRSTKQHFVLTQCLYLIVTHAHVSKLAYTCVLLYVYKMM